MQRRLSSLFWAATLGAIMFAAGGAAQRDHGGVVGVIDSEQRTIWVPAAINSHTVSLLLDTGCEVSIFLGRDAFSRTGVEEHGEKDKYGRTIMGEGAVECAVGVGETLIGLLPDTAAAGALPRGCDGVFGWPSLSNRIVRFDWAQRRVLLLDRLPEIAESAGWTTWKIIDGRVLVIEASLFGHPRVRILLDTGEGGGVTVSPELWDRYSHTLRGRRTAGIQLFPGYGRQHAAPVAWCDYLQVGGLCLRGMPVRRGDSAIVARFGQHARIGLLALSRFDVIVDGPGKKMHVRPRRHFAWPYQYNRLGAAFSLSPVAGGGEFVASVVARGSPAEKVGLRTGDRLIATNGRQLSIRGGLSDWSPFVELAQFHGPAGTRIHLRWRRGRREMEAVAKLEEIFPDAAKYGPLPLNPMHESMSR